MEHMVLGLFESLNEAIVKYNPYYDKDLIRRAFDFAYNAHKGTYRVSKDPYVVHALCSALYLTKIEADDTSLVAALIHDTLDNPKYTFSMIEEQFGSQVSEIVSGVQKLSAIEYHPHFTKHQIDELKKNIIMVGQDIRIFLVKIAERYHNLETLEYLDVEKRFRIAKETELIYLPIVNFLSIGAYLHQMHDLCFQYTTPEPYHELQAIFGKKKDIFENKIKEITRVLEENIEKLGIGKYSLESRIKSLYSIYKKIYSKNVPINEIYDVLAFRVITKDEKSAYIVLGEIHKLFNVKPGRFKDYISCPKENGYQSLHTTVYDDSGEFIEFQIQTKQMHKLNKTGIAAHFIYKGFGMEYHELPLWMKGVLDIQKKTIHSDKFLEKLKQELIISEIKCYFENGHPYVLPKGSTLLDFAFLVDEKYGKYFLGAYINGVHIEDPFTKLKNGDFIKIELQESVNTSYKIENFLLVKTQKARDALKEIFKKYSKSKLIDLGKYLLDTALEIYSYRHFSTYSLGIKNKIVKYFGLKDEKQLYLFIGIGGIDPEKVVKAMIQFHSRPDFTKEISLKIYLKVKDHTVVAKVMNIFYDMDLSVNRLKYNSEKNFIFVEFHLDTKSTLGDLIAELQRAPNVANIIRIFPMRLQMYYILFFVSLLIGPALFGSFNIFEAQGMHKKEFLDLILLGSSAFMLFLIFFVKYLVRTVLPDVLKYRKFWWTQIFLNTYIIVLIFAEFMYLGYNLNFYLFSLFCIGLYSVMIYEYLCYKKNQKLI